MESGSSCMQNMYFTAFTDICLWPRGPGTWLMAMLNSGRGREDTPRPRLVRLKENEQGGLIVAVQELHIDDVQQLLIQLPDVDDVAGQET